MYPVKGARENKEKRPFFTILCRLRYNFMSKRILVSITIHFCVEKDTLSVFSMKMTENYSAFVISAK